jgi:hypothetical protein
MLAGYEAEGFFGVGAEFIRGSSPARIIARGQQPAAQSRLGIFKPAHVVALPTMYRNGHAAKLVHRGIRFHAPSGILFLGQTVGLFHSGFIHGNILYSEKVVEKKPGLFSIKVEKATVPKNCFR